MYLREFLKKHKVLTKFKANYTVQNQKKQRSIESLLKYNDFRAERSAERYIQDMKNRGDAIDLAFNWQNTPEGRRFWNALHNKWLTILFCPV